MLPIYQLKWQYHTVNRMPLYYILVLMNQAHGQNGELNEKNMFYSFNYSFNFWV